MFDDRMLGVQLNKDLIEMLMKQDRGNTLLISRNLDTEKELIMDHIKETIRRLINNNSIRLSENGFFIENKDRESLIRLIYQFLDESNQINHLTLLLSNEKVSNHLVKMLLITLQFGRQQHLSYTDMYELFLFCVLYDSLRYTLSVGNKESDMEHLVFLYNRSTVNQYNDDHNIPYHVKTLLYNIERGNSSSDPLLHIIQSALLIVSYL